MKNLLIAALAAFVALQDPAPERIDLQATGDAISDLHFAGASRLHVFGAQGYVAAFDPARKLEGRLPLTVKDDILAVAADGQTGRLYLAGKDGMVRAFDPGSKEPSALFPDDELWADQPIRAVAVSADGKLVAAGGQSRRVRVYEVETKKELKPFTASGGIITALAFAADGKSLACANDRGRIHVIDPRNPQEVREVKGHTDRVTDLAIDEGAKLLHSASTDGTLRTFDLATGEEKRKLEPVEGPILAMKLAPAAEPKPLLLVVGANGRTVVLNAADGSKVRELDRRPEATAARLDSTGKSAAIAYRGGSIALYRFDRTAGPAAAVPPPPPPATPSPAPAPAPTGLRGEAAEHYASLAAHLGLILKPVDEGRKGYQVERILLGFDRAPQGPGPGDIITHFWEGIFIPLDNLAHLPTRNGTVAVRFRNAQGQDRQADLQVNSADQIVVRRRMVDALLNNQPLYVLGIGSTAEGVVAEVPPGPAWDAGIREKDWILSVQGEPWAKRPLSRVWTADPIELEILSGGGKRKVVVTPKAWPPKQRDQWLGRWLVAAGREEEGRPLIERSK